MTRNTLIMLSLICVAVGVASVFIIVSPRPDATSNADPLHLASIDIATVTAVAVSNASSTRTLTHVADSWTFMGVPVATSSIMNLLEGIAHAHETLVAKNGRSVPAYGLVSDPYQLSFVSYTGTTTLDIGAQDYATNGTYVSLPGSNEVYLVDGALLARFVQDDWTAWQQQMATSTTSTSSPPVPSVAH
jgi:hypothetical protein